MTATTLRKNYAPADGESYKETTQWVLAHIVLAKKEVDTASAAHVLLRLPPTQDQRVGAVNMHPSLLRLYRGATSVQIALQVRVKETGVSVAFTFRALEVGANNNPFSCGNIYSYFLFAGKKGKFDLGKIWTLEVIELSGCIIYAPEIWKEFIESLYFPETSRWAPLMIDKDYYRPGNFACSPLSFDIILGMLAVGAEGETLKQ
ncbi:protein pigment defective 194 [Tanacetum coccineum]